MPSRGPAARALTVSRWDTPYAAASGWSAPSRRTLFTFSSSATIDSNPSSRSAPATTTVSSDRGSRLRSEAPLRSADPAEHTSRTWSMADTSSASSGSESADGQSVRCTDRSAVSPRQTSSAVSGSSGAVTRQTISRTVKSVSKASSSTRPSAAQKRSRDRRMYQFESTSRKRCVVSHAFAISYSSSCRVDSSTYCRVLASR